MDSFMAFVMGEATRGRELMVFDWDKAARLIREKKPEIVEAGLRDDWEWTGGEIYRDGKAVFDDHTYLYSTWAVPEISLDGEIISCYKMRSETPGWDAETKWPESSLEILNG